ncbi:MAG: tetratricopeptide repeat protein [Hyphomicrobiales bacterium]|nr:tetratricopeptide repeat protein [Hyphomicrobiales bacterium]
MLESARERLRFRLLGQVALTAGHADLPVRVSSQKGLALLAYLAMNAGRPIARSVLADLLWGDRPEPQARQNLRQAILTLRRDLGAACGGSLHVDNTALSLAISADDVDALQFAAWAASPDPAQRRRCLDIPFAPFLDQLAVGSEPFDEWAGAERHRLDTLATRVFSDLAKQFNEAGDGERAILAVERLIAIDPAGEDHHRRLLTLEMRYRGADAALARGRELVAMLKREFDAAPEASTVALLEDIRRGRQQSAADIGAARTQHGGEQAVVPVDPASDHQRDNAILGSAAWEARAPLALMPRVRTALALAGVAILVAGGAALFWSGGAYSSLRQDAGALTSDLWRSPPLPSGRPLNASSDRKKDIAAIVVLPFKTYEDVESVRTLADMMTDDLTNMLSRVPTFRVISRQTARTFRTRSIDVAEVGRELGVHYALEGSLRMQGDRVRVAVELTDTTTRTVVWSARFEREEVNRQAVQDEIVRRLARELQMGSYPIESARLSNDPSADARAQHGMAALQASFSNISLDAYDRARALFAEALALDPTHISARLGLASYHANVAVQRLVTDPNRHLDEAHAILRAVIRDRPEISGAYLQLGIILQSRGRMKEAIEAFERAIELNPSMAGAHAHIGFVLARTGRAEEGIEHIRYAMRLSPKDPSLAIWLEFAGAAELELGHYDKAVENFRRSIALTPNYPRPWAGLVAAHALAGDMDSAHASAERLRALSPKIPPQQLYKRFARLSSRSPKLQEGLSRGLGQ